jgi:histidinol-phosphate phosphatase family protein
MPTVFLDRDGVINRKRLDYVKRWDEFELLPDAIRSIVRLCRGGFDVVVVTNQSAIGRGIISDEALHAIHERLANRVTAAGGSIRAFLVCPHTPDEGCGCRKPRPGLFLRARDELQIDLSQAVAIGDQLSDVEAANAAGCGSAFLIADSDDGSESAAALGATVAAGLTEAVDMITDRLRVTDAIILCGGLGSRLRGVLGDRPKCMALLHNRPFLEWKLLSLAAQGVKRVVLATGHRAEAVRDHFSDGTWRGLELAFSNEETPLGTGGAVRRAAQLVHARELLVLNGDSYCTFDLCELSRVHRLNDAVATLWLEEIDGTGQFGGVEIGNKGIVTGFWERRGNGGSGLVNAGVYLLQRELLLSIPTESFSLEKDLFPGLVGQGLYSCTGDGFLVDIGTPESLRDAERLLTDTFKALEEQPWTSD